MTTNINLEISPGLFHGLSGILNLQPIMTISVGINATAPRTLGLLLSFGILTLFLHDTFF